MDADAQEDQSVMGWLISRGLEKYAEKVAELTEAERLDDFKLLDASRQSGSVLTELNMP